MQAGRVLPHLPALVWVAADYCKRNTTPRFTFLYDLHHSDILLAAPPTTCVSMLQNPYQTTAFADRFRHPLESACDIPDTTPPAQVL